MNVDNLLKLVGSNRTYDSTVIIIPDNDQQITVGRLKKNNIIQTKQTDLEAVIATYFNKKNKDTHTGLIASNYGLKAMSTLGHNTMVLLTTPAQEFVIKFECSSRTCCNNNIKSKSEYSIWCTNKKYANTHISTCNYKENKTCKYSKLIPLSSIIDNDIVSMPIIFEAPPLLWWATYSSDNLDKISYISNFGAYRIIQDISSSASIALNQKLYKYPGFNMYKEFPQKACYGNIPGFKDWQQFNILIKLFLTNQRSNHEIEINTPCNLICDDGSKFNLQSGTRGLEYLKTFLLEHQTIGSDEKITTRVVPDKIDNSFFAAYKVKDLTTHLNIKL